MTFEIPAPPAFLPEPPRWFVDFYLDYLKTEEGRRQYPGLYEKLLAKYDATPREA